MHNTRHSLSTVETVSFRKGKNANVDSDLKSSLHHPYSEKRIIDDTSKVRFGIALHMYTPFYVSLSSVINQPKPKRSHNSVQIMKNAYPHSP